MKKRTRLCILIFCVICFFAIAPVLVAYSMGYRFDFGNRKIVGTGGIYVRTFPAAEQIVVDSKILAKPGIFSNAIFVQSLLPREHTVSIQKSGYYDYFKTLPVEEKTVTKLENVTLFKKSLKFSVIAEKIDIFSIAPDNRNIITSSNGAKVAMLNYFNLESPGEARQTPIAAQGKILEIKWSENSLAALIKTLVSNEIFYYFFDASGQTQTVSRLPYLDRNSKQISFNPLDIGEIFYVENKTLYSLKDKKPSVVIKNLLSYTISGNNILWVSANGALNESDFTGSLVKILTDKSLAGGPNAEYKVTAVSGKIFLQENNSLLLFNPGANAFKSFDAPAGDYEILAASNGENFIFKTSSEIYVYSSLDKTFEKLRSGSEIKNVQWLNNDYIIFSSENEIIISEIDYRGNINAVSLPKEAAINETKNIDTSNYRALYYALPSGRLYILAEEILLVSEKLTP